jgi:hypothetical protein
LGQGNTLIYRIDPPQRDPRTSDAWLIRAAMRLMPAELAKVARIQQHFVAENNSHVFVAPEITGVFYSQIF